MKTFDYVITDKLGIHARPAGLLVKEAKALDSQITVSKGEKSCGATKLLALMNLGIKFGDTITVRIEGGNEDASMQAIKAFLAANL